MSNLETLIEAGIVPRDHTLSEDDSEVIETLSLHEVKTLVDLKEKLGDDLLRRNISDAGNFFL
jgi:hypothetical protein